MHPTADTTALKFLRRRGGRVMPGVKDDTTALYPRMNAATFKRAARQRRAQGEQGGLF